MSEPDADLAAALGLAGCPGQPIILALDTAERAVLRHQLGTTAPAARRLAIVLDPATTATELGDVLTQLERSDPAVADLSIDPTTWLQQLEDAAPGGEELARSDYELFFVTLPATLQQAVLERWGPLEDDPCFQPGELDCGRFLLPGWQHGPIAIGRPPVSGYRLAGLTRQTPPHAYLAFYCWLRDGLRVPLAIDLSQSPHSPT